MKRISTLLIAAALVLVAAAAPQAGAQTQPLREFEGTVLSVSTATKSFRLRDSERGTIRVYVNRRTRFERINGLRGLRRGMTSIEVTVRRSNGRWVAREVERSGGGGRHGGDDDD